MKKFIVLAISSIAIAASFSMPVAAAPIAQVRQACDNMNKQKAGTCTMKPTTFKVLAGCAQEVGKTPVCFECPVDGKRMCFADAGRGGKFLNVTVSASGTNVEAVTKGCDLVANDQNKGKCHYDIVSRTGTVGSTTVSGVAFECDDKDCHATAGKRLP